MKQVVLTGIKPTGTPHIGNYFGAIKQAIEMSNNNEFDNFYFIADYHALNSLKTKEDLQKYTKELACTWLACGLDPEKVLFYRQSQIQESTELCWILMNVTPKGLMDRAHAYKACVQANEQNGKDADDGINMGLYNYPILMAADILLFNSKFVPVGADFFKYNANSSGKNGSVEIILYYLDANGRYDTLERLQGLLDFAKDEGILDRIILLEEPFAEDNKIDVSSLPVRIVADESAHSLKDVEERIKLGYKAVALKAIAKTLSESLKILAKATEEGVECFCADLTVTPYVLEFNKNVASRIKPLPELKVGLLESNGEQNYVDWAKLTSYHPMSDKKFVSCKDGVFTLDDEFFKVSGGIFRYSKHYDNVNQ